MQVVNLTVIIIVAIVLVMALLTWLAFGAKLPGASSAFRGSIQNIALPDDMPALVVVYSLRPEYTEQMKRFLPVWRTLGFYLSGGRVPVRLVNLENKHPQPHDNIPAIFYRMCGYNDQDQYKYHGDVYSPTDIIYWLDQQNLNRDVFLDIYRYRGIDDRCHPRANTPLYEEVIIRNDPNTKRWNIDDGSDLRETFAGAASKGQIPDKYFFKRYKPVLEVQYPSGGQCEPIVAYYKNKVLPNIKERLAAFGIPVVFAVAGPPDRIQRSNPESGSFAADGAQRAAFRATTPQVSHAVRDPASVSGFCRPRAVFFYPFGMTYKKYAVPERLYDAVMTVNGDTTYAADMVQWIVRTLRENIDWPEFIQDLGDWDNSLYEAADKPTPILVLEYSTASVCRYYTTTIDRLLNELPQELQRHGVRVPLTLRQTRSGVNCCPQILYYPYGVNGQLEYIEASLDDTTELAVKIAATIR